MEAPADGSITTSARKRKFYETGPSSSTKDPKTIKPPEKRRRRQDAQEISVQTTESAFRDGQFDAVSFVNSREYEMRSLLRSMNSSKNAQRKRAFQSLPRELRRRTAAHNPSRVPKRVRVTARMELAEDNTIVRKKRRDYRPSTRRMNANQLRILSAQISGSETVPKPWQPTLKLPGKGRSRFGSKSSRYRKRQRHKTWLPTHIWCAKRARMVCKWGFSLAETPNLKCYRPTYRAATRDGCLAVDTSYYATILMEGREKDLKRSLAKFLPPRDLAIVGKSVVSGESARSTWMHEEGEWPKGTLAPVQIFWCPRESSGEIQEQERRKVVLRVHPASWEDAWTVATACTLHFNCTCKNLRFEIGSIGLIGPRTANIFKALLQLGLDIGDLPVGGVIYSSGRDPRLNFLYLRDQIPASASKKSPAAGLAGGLFDTKCRHASVKAQVSQKTLNSQISGLISGENIGPAAETKIPFVLIRESVGEQILMDCAGSESPLSQRWSILLPWRWVRLFWLVLMRMPGVRLGGLKELEQLTLESGLGSFPIDFPSTKAGNAAALERLKERLDRVKRRNTMKTKSPSKGQVSAALVGSTANADYPWGAVLEVDGCRSRERPKVWQLTSELVRLFWKTQRSKLPPSLSQAIFTAYIRILGRGNIDPYAYIYNLSGFAAKLVSQKILQHSRDGKSLDGILEVFDSEAQQTEEPPYSLAGFVIRRNFGFREAAPIAMAALAWEKVYKGEPGENKGGFGGWCILQNGDRGAKRLAQWVPI